ncbi:MAG TPA: hypothetical protein VF614_14695 [Chthoniobacteraceae bacterium]
MDGDASNPLPPLTLLRLIRLWPHARRHGREIGQLYRVGYYSPQDGLDCVWLVDRNGAYNWTADHAFVAKHFEMIRRSRERSRYGAQRPRLSPLTDQELPENLRASP